MTKIFSNKIPCNKSNQENERHSENLRYWKYKLKKVLEDGKNTHTHGLVGLILLKWPSYQKQ